METVSRESYRSRHKTQNELYGDAAAPVRDQNQTGLTEQQLNRIAMLGPDGVKMVSLLFCTLRQ